MIKSIQNTGKVLLNNISPSDQTKEKIKDLASKVYSFIKENKGLVFFGATVLMSALVAPVMGPAASITAMGALNLFTTGMLAASALQFTAILYGNKGFADKDSDEKFSFLLGSANLCTQILFPQASLATAIFTSGVKGCLSLCRHFHEVRLNSNY